MANRKQRVILIVLSILLSLVVVNPALYALIWHVQHGNRVAAGNYSSCGGYRVSELGHVAAGEHLHCAIACNRLLFSVTYKLNMFGTCVACSSCVA